MMRQIALTYGLFFSLILSLFAQDPVDYVNPFIGTSNYGATHPGPVMPNGLVSVVPFNAAFKKGAENVFEKDSEWHSRPYVVENRFLTGFSHVNLSGVGCPELGSILLMPTTGDLEFDAEQHGAVMSEESAEAGYYCCRLEKYGIDAEMTATLRSGRSRYTFPAGQANILLNLGLGLTNETGAMLRIVSDRKVEGFKMIGTFCYNPEDVRPVYFVARLSRPAERFGAWKKMPKYGPVEADWTRYDDAYKPYAGYTRELAGEDIGAYFSFDLEEESQIEVQVGISYVSIDNARQNLEAEQNGQDFASIQQANRRAWNQLLQRIRVKGGSREDKTIFYTALYHVLMHPNILQDVNGEYPAMEGNAILNAGDADRYTVFSLWDTYRNVHPFLSLVYPDLQTGMVRSMVDMAEESGWLPKWELLSMETAVMVGDPATPVIADTYLRGLTDFAVEKAYDYARKAALRLENNKLRPGIQYYDSLGYIPEGAPGAPGGTVSTTLEYNISDWNLSRLAEVLGKDADAERFSKRALSYRNYFDPGNGMLRPRMGDGSWLSPFNPEAGKNFEPVIGYIEGNAWQYRFYVPHDMEGLIDLLGGEKAFLQELEACFETDNYDMANEPDITYAYLYNFVKGEEWRTQKRVRELIRKHYFDGPAGIPGNDDTGTLSTWLLYGMLGIYPHCPGDMRYAITSPVFDEVRIQLDPDYYTGTEIVIEANKSEVEALYIDRIRWNGKRHRSFFIEHQELTRGGVLSFDLDTKPR